MKSISIILALVAGFMVAIATAAEASQDTVPTASPAFPSADPSGPVMLREVVSITDEVIYLSDLFMNVDDRLADKVVAYAPEPGRQAAYGAQWLYRVAHHYRLDWRPRTLRDQAVVTRESFVIEREQIEETIKFHLVEQGMDPEMNAELANRNIRLFLPVDEMPDIAVDDLRYDERTKRFTAMISAPANSPNAQTYRLTGRVFQVTEIPVLTRHITAYEVITQHDIEWQQVRSDKVSRETAMDLSDLVGMSPKRGLRPGLPVRLSEIAAPLVVSKKSLVTIIFQHPFMTLTAQGRSLQSGAVGDVIRVRNVQSNKIVDAEVIGAGKAVVRSIELLAMNQSN